MQTITHASLWYTKRNLNFFEDPSFLCLCTFSPFQQPWFSLSLFYTNRKSQPPPSNHLRFSFSQSRISFIRNLRFPFSQSWIAFLSFSFDTDQSVNFPFYLSFPSPIGPYRFFYLPRHKHQSPPLLLPP